MFSADHLVLPDYDTPLWSGLVINVEQRWGRKSSLFLGLQIQLFSNIFDNFLKTYVSHKDQIGSIEVWESVV